ncbi:DUF4192 domain-containing protein [Streptomyces sp. NPDC056468]|uniref:DUF4192 domain-containing protein n=1 Tax=Streptomyces sp. NPDC056468 TaxID=3345830 RepID=UPI00368F411A
MTNHSEATGFSESDDAGRGEQPLAPGTTDPNEAGLPEHQVTLRTPAELADALPYLLGYRPEDSIVLVALHDRAGRGRFGGRARLGIPASTDDWDSAAAQLAHGLVTGSERRGVRPEQMVAFLCQEPAKGETGRQVMERLRPLAQKMRVACGNLDVPVIEALCISDGRFWSYCCDRAECCPPEGRPMGLPGTSVLAAAATYAGVQVRGTLRELRSRLLPWETAGVPEQEAALDTVGVELVTRILDDTKRAGVAVETLELAERLRCRFAEASPVSGTLTADLRDDGLLSHDEAARLILGLQDRATRDRAAEWMEGDEAAPALRLWRALARRCVGPYSEHAAAPLTLAGWVAWSTGDELEAREALAMALGVDRDYLFARLLHQACNEGLDPESIRRCLRAERVSREEEVTGRLDHPEDVEEPVRGTGSEPAPTSGEDGGRRSRETVGAAGSLPRSARGTGRSPGERGARRSSAARPRASAGSRPGAVRPGGTVPGSSKGSAPRTSRKGDVRRSGPRPDGLRSGGAGGEGDA